MGSRVTPKTVEVMLVLYRNLRRNQAAWRRRRETQSGYGLPANERLSAKRRVDSAQRVAGMALMPRILVGTTSNGTRTVARQTVLTMPRSVLIVTQSFTRPSEYFVNAST